MPEQAGICGAHTLQAPLRYRLLAVRRCGHPSVRSLPGALLLAAIAMTVLPGTVYCQEGEGAGADHIKIQRVKVVEKKGVRTITVRARAKDVPRGTKVQFRLLFRSAVIRTFKFTVQGPSISAEFKAGKIPVSPDKFMFATVIDSKEQTGKVRSALRGDPKGWPPALDPWTEYHRSHQFSIATESEIRAEIDFVRAFYLDSLSALSKLRSSVRAEAKKAEAGESYCDKEGNLEAKKWRKWFDKNAVEELKKIQKSIAKTQKAARFMPYRGLTMRLKTIGQIVAWQVLERSKVVYKAHDLEPDEMDTKPEEHALDIDAPPAERKGSAGLKRIAKQIRTLLPKSPAAPKPTTPGKGKAKGETGGKSQEGGEARGRASAARRTAWRWGNLASARLDLPQWQGKRVGHDFDS